jgi:hypothetical protein
VLLDLLRPCIKTQMVGGASHLNLVSRRVKIPLEIDFFFFRINGRVCYL